MLEISSTCRSCMKSNTDLVDLFVPLSIDNCTLQLADIMMTTVSVQISKEDGLPQQICKVCSNFLQSVQTFRAQVLHAEQELKRLCALQTEVKNEMDFKNEEESDSFDTYDNFIQCDVVPKEETDVKNEGRIEMVCDICEKTYTNHNRYLKHLTSHNQGNFVCRACNKTFHKESALTRHIDKYCKSEKVSEQCNTLENVIKAETDEDAPFKCPHCPLSFIKHRSLLSHRKKHKVKHKETQNYRCDICNKEFSLKSVLLRHLKLHSTSERYQCSECSKAYSRQDQLEEHMHKHNGQKPHVCSHCGKAFSQLCSLKDHIRTHTKEAPYLCSECGKRFTNSSNLRQHLVRHTDYKPFSCNLCPKTFYTKGQMKAHISSHAGVHAYECPECGAALTTPSSLKKHRMIHLGIKPYPCDTCNMRFSDRNHLKRHQRIHTGEKPYKCAHCERAFSQSNDLIKHLRTHIGQNVYQCTICDMKFRLMSELKQHYPVHYINGNNMTQITDSQPATLISKTAQVTKDSGPLDVATSANNPTENQITITFNDVIDKDGLAGGITINISPTKS